MWPSVSSPSMPSPSQRIFCTPRKSRKRCWISVLIKKARFTGEERARAVHFDRAAFQNHPRIKNRGFQDLGHARRHDFIEIERRIFISPCIVIPIDDREFWIDIARQKNRAV